MVAGDISHPRIFHPPEADRQAGRTPRSTLPAQLGERPIPGEGPGEDLGERDIRSADAGAHDKRAASEVPNPGQRLPKEGERRRGKVLSRALGEILPVKIHLFLDYSSLFSYKEGRTLIRGLY